MEKIKENKKTRKITWLCDLSGNVGKSMFTDILEEHPQYECLILMIDSYRSFKYTSARLISNYIDKKGRPPKAFLIDAPRDEESKYLHEIYGVLEEINNGRLYASFHGKIIKARIPRGIPIIIFSNSPPIFRALSNDRWDIKALYRTIDNCDVYVQNAKISSVIQKITYYSITWNNIIETLPYELESDSKSDKMLFDMYTQNFIAMEKEKELQGCSEIIPGLIKKIGVGQTTPINKAPEYILFEAQKKFP